MKNNNELWLILIAILAFIALFLFYLGQKKNGSINFVPVSIETVGPSGADRKY